MGVVLGVGLSLGVGAVAERGGDPAPAAPVPAAPVPATVALDLGAGAPVADAARRTPVVAAVERVAPAVVSIRAERLQRDPFWGGQSLGASDGSGVVIDEQGVVLTNAHVVEQAQKLTATFADGRRFEAELLGVAPELDLAVLRLRGATGLRAAPIGSSAGLLLGEPVIAIGNPFGLGHTVTTGVVSATSRALETEARVYQDFIQTDASINPGNSGGPLLDVTGALIGINTAVRADAQGIGFAIPVDRAVKVARDLVQFGEVQVPWLGVDLVDIVLRSPEGRQGAAQVVRVHPAGPAAAAGLQPGDLLRAVDGRPVQGRADLNAWLAGQTGAGAVRAELLRAGARVEATLQPGPVPAAVFTASLHDVLGVVPVERDGLVVVARVLPGGAFAARGLRVGDAILAVNGQPVRGLAGLEQLVLRAKSGHRPDALLTIRRGEAVARLTFPL
jgi:S1-C subfamily serine protease